MAGRSRSHIVTVMSHGPRILVCVLAGFLAIGCPPPPDAGRSRPAAVPSTPFSPHDVQRLGSGIRRIDEGPRDAPIVVLIAGHRTAALAEADPDVGS